MRDLLTGKVAAITGGGGGIGRAIAECFAQHGATVTVLDNSQDRLDQIETHFCANGWPLTTICGDACRDDDIQQLMASVEREHQRLDVLVNNVGDFNGLFKPLEEMSGEDIDSLLAVNLRHILIASRDAIPLMKKSGDGGSIIAISSVEGFRGMPNITPYGAAKAGIAGFARSLALELGPCGIRVNAIAPETTETQQVQPRQLMSKADYQRQSQWLPLGRFGQPEDTAGCALFLASDLSSWVTGSTIHCDGGALAAAGWYRTRAGQWTNTPVIDRGAIQI